jgi:hypothetical protein
MSEPTGPESGIGPGSASRAAFVNVGLNHWIEQRHRWLSRHRADGSKPVGRPKAVELSVESIENVITDAETVRDLPRPVPLPQMVDILVELWEEEGLFD